jgi:hypothetical protein
MFLPDQLVRDALRDLVRMADRFDVTEEPCPSVQGGRVRLTVTHPLRRTTRELGLAPRPCD